MEGKVTILAFGLLCCILGTQALNCYSCGYAKVKIPILGSSESGQSCKDTYSPSNSDSSACGTAEYCAKIKYKSDALGFETSGLTRACGYSTMCNKEGLQDSGNQVGDTTYEEVEVYCCMGDNCNAAGSLIPAAVLLVASALLAKVVV